MVIMGDHRGSMLLKCVWYSASGLSTGIVFYRLCNVLLQEYKLGSNELMSDLVVVIDITVQVYRKVVPR